MRKRRCIFTIITAFLLAILGSLSPFRIAHAGLLDFNLDTFGGMLGEFILGLTAKVVQLSGWLLDSAIDITVVGMSDFVNQLSSIELSWIIFRDFANIFFIFVLLYAAVATILRLSNFQTKQVVTRLVIVAIFINFSLFFTKVIIDASNIIALQFYNATQVCENPNEEGVCSNEQGGISKAFMNALQLTSIYNIETEDSQVSTLQDEEGSILEPDNIFAITIVGSLFFLITAFVFFAGALLFVIRFALLILVMVAAPLALLAFVLPQTKQYGRMWFNTLLKQSFFAPAFLALTYFTARIVSDPQFKATLYGEGSLATEIGGFAAGSANVTLAFAIVISLMIATLTVSQKMGGGGARTITSWGTQARKWAQNKMKTGSKSLPGFAWRKTGGRAASYAAGTDGLQNFASRNKFGEFALKNIKKTGSGYDKQLEAQKKERVEFAKMLDTPQQKVRYAQRLENSNAFGIPGVKTSRKNKEGAKEVYKLAGINKDRLEAVTKGLRASENPPGTSATTEEKRIYTEAIASMEKAIGAMSGKEVAKLDESILTNKKIVSLLSSGQIKAVMESDDLKPATKDKVKTERKAGLLEIVSTTNGIEKLMKRGPAEVAKLPAEVLVKKEVAINLSPASLSKIVSTQNDETRDIIRTNIEDAITELNAGTLTLQAREEKQLRRSHQYLTNPGGGQNF